MHEQSCPWLPPSLVGSWGGGRGTPGTCLAPQFQGRSKPDYLTKLFQETDLNKDKELSFEEFLTVLSKVADDSHRITHGHGRCGPDRD